MAIDRAGFQETPSTDHFTGFGIEIGGDHAYIHDGRAFSAMGSVNMAANSFYDLTLTTPAASVGYVHYRPARFSSSASYCKVSIIEAPTFTAGTAGAAINRERNNTRAAGTVYKYNAGYTSGGTVLDTLAVGSGGNPNARGGGSDGSAEEFVLKPATTYLIRIENLAGGATTNFLWNLFWYEEANG